MRHKKTNRKRIPDLFLILITMVAIAVFIQVDRLQNKSEEIRAKAYRQTPTGVRVEAEEMTLSGVVLDSTGTFIQFTGAETGTETPSPPNPTPVFACPLSGLPAAGIATIDVDLNQHGNYKMWIQMKGGGDNTNSVWLQLDKLYCVKVGDLAGMPADTWEWVDYQNGNTAEKIPTPLIGTGHHIIKLIGNASEPGVAVDRILMMIDISCVPTGNGDACIDVVNTPTPTAVPPTSTPTPIPTPVPPTPTPTPIPINTDPPIILTTSLPKAKRNISYTADVIATDATISDILGMSAVNLPTGLAIPPCSQTTGLGGTRLTCRIAGIPTKKGAYFPVFTAIDAIGHKTSKKIKLQVE
jgi:hypothetical protein